MKISKPAVLLAASALAVATVAVPVAASVVSEPAKAYGVCVHKSTGAARVLERTNLSRSRYGKCRSVETKITLPSVSGLPTPPARLVFNKPTGTETCNRDTEKSSTSTWTFACTFAIASPSPSN